MENKTKIPQVYGYSVCIVAIITFLITLAGIISSVIESTDPLHSWGNQHLSSFENFKMHTVNSNNNENNYLPDDNTLRIMYEDAKDYEIRKVKLQTTKSIFTNGLIFLISIILFIIHWRWMKQPKTINLKQN